MSTSVRPQAGLAAVLAAMFVPTVAAGQQYSQEAIRSFQAGVEAYDRGDLDAAIRFFRESYEVHRGHPIALYNIGECYERLGEVELAVEHFERYVASEQVEERDQVYERIRNLRSRRAVFTLRSTPPGATVTVWDEAGNRLSEFPDILTPGEVHLPPGTFVLRFDMAGMGARSQVVEGGVGRRVTLDVAMSEPVAPPDVTAPGEWSVGPLHFGAYGGLAAHLNGAAEVFAASGFGVFGGYVLGEGEWRFQIGGDLSFLPYGIDAGDRHFSSFVSISAVPGVRWALGDSLHLTGSLAAGLSLYVPPGNREVVVPWVGHKVDGIMSLLHFRPAVAVEWFPLDWLAIWVSPLALDLDVALRSQVATQILVRYAAFAGVTFHL